MRLFLIFQGRFPNEKAASIFAAQSAVAFAGEGVETTLIVPRRFGTLLDDPYEFYGVPKNFSIVRLPTIDLYYVPVIGVIAHHVSLITFAVSVFLYLLLRARKDDCAYSNEALPLLAATFVATRSVYEMHDFPEHKQRLYAWVFRRVNTVLVTNTWKVAPLEKGFSVHRSKILIEPNAVDIEKFSIAMSKNEARAALRILKGGHIVVYTGHLYAWKGVDTLASAARLLPKTEFYVVGGTEADVKAYIAKYSDIQNLHVVGRRLHSEIPLWQKAADVLVLPNTAKEEISAHYTSPMKLFEYMASGTPIVASDIPAIREIVGDERAVLVRPDDARALADGITRVLTNGGITESDAALIWVQDHTWQKRAQRVLAKIE